MREDLWINQDGLVPNFVILIIAVWVLVIGVAVGIAAVRRRPALAEIRPAGLVLGALLYGLIPAVLLTVAFAGVEAALDRLI